MQPLTRRDALRAGAALSAGAALAWAAPRPARAQAKGDLMGFGLVTYMWGADWDLPTLLTNVADAGLQGVELRTTHKHGVEPTLTADERAEVRARFEESGVTLVGIGSDERFDNPDPAVVRKAIDATKRFISLSHDVGGSGVKVKPDRFHEGVEPEKTIAQIAAALNELGEFGAGYGQQIRLEVHGQCAELPTIRAILDQVTDENVGVCWNSNAVDLQGAGLAANFDLVKDRFGATCHVRELDSEGYPWAELVELLVGIDYAGWVLLECTRKEADRVAAMAKQKELFTGFIQAAQDRLGE